MPTASEAAGNGGQLKSALVAGLNELSKNETVVFTQYTRVPLAPDSSVFWVASSTMLTAIGSLHYSTDRMQNVDETVAQNTFIFTSEQEVTAFNTVSPTTMWIGTWTVDGASLLITFSSRGRFYEESQLWHYVGVAVLPAMQSQLLANSGDLPPGPIVSNSLPIWLSLTTYPGGTVPIFPSWLVLDNIVPPYIVVRIEAEETIAIQNFPIGIWPGNASSGDPLQLMASSQLCRDDVELIFYGFTAQQITQYYWMLIDYSLNVGGFGFGPDNPVPRDPKRTQREIATIAQKKTLRILANYYQNTAEATARRLILDAEVSSWTVSSTP